MRISPYLALAVPLALAASFSASALAQSPSAAQSTTTLKVQANEVLLPVTVRDKHGNLVTNLTAADFTLSEDNRPQVIKSFSTQSDLPFLCGLLVDTSRSVSGALDNERAAAGKFVDLMLPADPKNAKEGDQAFLIHFDREVELLRDFTNSRDKLHRELTEMGPTTAEHNNPQGPETGDDNGGNGGSRGGRARGGGTQLYDAVFLASDELMKRMIGRKALIVFSDGVDRGSKDTINEAIESADRANVSVYTIYFKGQEERSDNGFPGGGRRGGGGYPGGGGGGWPGGGGGYPGGGGGGRRGSETQSVDGKKIMEQLATRTGGRYFEAKKKENLDDIYNQIAQELRGQYLLTYTPDQTDNDGAYHKIALKAKNDDLTVITREGYYAPGGNSN